MSIWDDPDMKVGGDYIKFENPGDSVTGKVLSIGAHRWDDGSVSPQLRLETSDGEKLVTAGQVMLKSKLAEARPEVGDTLTITFDSIEKRNGGKTLKHFTVTVGNNNSWNAAPISKADAKLAEVDPEVLAALKKQLGAAPF